MKTITIPTNVTTLAFTMNLTDNDIVECPESFNVTIVSVIGSGVTTGSVYNTEVAILDDDGNLLCISLTSCLSVCMH